MYCVVCLFEDYIVTVRKTQQSRRADAQDESSRNAERNLTVTVSLYLVCFSEVLFL